MSNISSSVEGLGLAKVDTRHIPDVCMRKMQNKQTAQHRQELAQIELGGYPLQVYVGSRGNSIGFPVAGIGKSTRQYERNATTVSTSCSREDAAVHRLTVVVGKVDTTVQDLRQELSASQSQVNRLNRELTSSTTHLRSGESVESHTRIVSYESQQLSEDPYHPTTFV